MLSVTKLIIFIIFHPSTFVTEIMKSENAKICKIDEKNNPKHAVFDISV